jgi:hypothetical protein
MQKRGVEEEGCVVEVGEKKKVRDEGERQGNIKEGNAVNHCCLE